MQRRDTDRRGHLLTIILGASLAAGACSGAPTASSGTAAPLASTSALVDATTAPSDAPADASSLPTDPPASGSTQPVDTPKDVCAPFAGGAQPPATAEETALLDRMPKTVDGEPLRFQRAYRFIQDICSSENFPDDVVQAVMETFGLDLRTVVIGNFGVTVEGSMFSVEVYRAPGHDANTILTGLAAIGRIDPADFRQGSVGGKDVMSLEDGYGGANYRYLDGDTIWAFNVLSDAQAAKIIAALEGSA